MADDEGRERTGPGGQERRSGERLPLEMWVEEITDGSQVFRRAGNLSRGGMYLDQTIPIPMGTKVQLRFTLPGDKVPLVVTAQIVSIHATDALGMGVKFVDLDATTQDRITAYLSRTATAGP